MDDDELNDLLNEDIPEWEDENNPEVASADIDSKEDVDSILNEDEDIGADLEADLNGIDLGSSFSTYDTLSLSSSDTASIASRRALAKRRMPKPCLILKHGILKGASNQLHSAKSKVDSGSPSTLTVRKYLAIGTTRGFIFVFDMKQVLKFCLGNSQYGREFGAVSSLSFNRDSSRLLAGFAKGQMVMFDVAGSQGKTLRTISDAHPPGTAVLFVRFTDDPTVAVCADSSGSVFQLAFKRGIAGRTCESVCLFTGCRGEICCIEPLTLPPSLQDRHPINAFSLLAMASFTSLNIVSLKPQVYLQYRHMLKGHASTLPQLSWRFVTIERGATGQRVEPVLAFGRDMCIHLLRGTMRSDVQLHFEMIQTINLQYQLLAVKWLGQYTMALIDVEENLRIVDVPTESELEVLDLGPSQLCYNTSLFKSLATGGNVSEALAYAAERACYHSVVAFEGQLLVLGQPSMHLYVLRSWEERLTLLMKNNQPEAALCLCEEFYRGGARGVTGLPSVEAARHWAVKERAVALVEEHITQLMASPFPDTEDRFEEVYSIFSEAVSSAVKLCITIEKQDILEELVYDRIKGNPAGKAAFLDSIQPMILEGRLPSVPPSVIKDLVERCNEQGRVSDMEQCITRLSVASLDLDQETSSKKVNVLQVFLSLLLMKVVKICWANGLYNAIFYIYNQAFEDFLTPLEQLTEKLLNWLASKKRLSVQQEALGHKLFVYIRCCLAGESYLGGENNNAVNASTQEEIFQYILKPLAPSGSGSSSLGRYPHLYAYLQLSAVDFLNMVTLAMEDSFFQGDNGLIRKQALIDSVIAVMLERREFSASQIGAFFVFLSRQLVRPENVQLTFDQSVFHQVLEFLCLGDDKKEEVRSLEQQQAVIDLLQSGRLAPTHNRERLMQMARRAGFYQVCEYLYRDREEYAPIVECYLKDPIRKTLVFDFVESALSATSINDSEKGKVRSYCLQFAQDLVAVCPERSVSLLLGCVNHRIDHLTQTLDKRGNGQNETLFKFLEAFFTLRQNPPSDGQLEDVTTCAMNPAVAERYLELLCSFRPTAAYAFVKNNSDYRSAAALDIIRLHDLPRVMALLLERLGEIDKANSIYLKLFDSAWQSLVAVRNASDANDSAVPLESNIKRLETSAQDIITLCRRSASTRPKDRQESLWFPMLDSMLVKQRHLKDSTLLGLIKSLFQSLLNAMNPHISLPSILTRMLQDPTYEGEKFGEIQTLILGMLETFNYEHTLLQTCRRLLHHDLRRHRLQFLDLALRGYGPRKYRCQVCSRLFKGAFSDQLVVFKCGHGYHSGCLRDTTSYFTAAGQVTWVCLICTNLTMQMKAGPSAPLLGGRGHPSTPTDSSSIGVVGGRSSPHADPSTKAKGSAISEEISDVSRQRYDQLRKDMKSSNRVAMLKELLKPVTERRPTRATSPPSTDSRFSDLLGEFRELKLAPPPL